MSITYSSQGRPYTGPIEIHYLFVDGASLRTILEDYSKVYFRGAPIELDYGSFMGYYSKVFYYDSIPAKRSGESESAYDQRMNEIQERFDKMALLDKFHVNLGSSYLRRKVVRQKKVDIMIATDMLTHAFHRNMDTAALIASDTDFKPLIDALVQNGMHVELWYGNTKNCKASRELLTAADRRIKIDLRVIYQHTLPAFKESFSIPRGGTYHDFEIKPTNEIHSWGDTKFGEVALYLDEETYSVGYLNPEFSVHTRFVQFSDLPILETYLKEEEGLDIGQRGAAFRKDELKYDGK